jgi:trimethylamine--corrinoid protein Co-methyltransferase
MITFSPLQLAIDNEMARYVRYSIRGFEVNEETLALEVIQELGHGGQAFDHPHTVSNFRKLQMLSPFFDLCPWGMGDSLDRERFEKRAAAKVQQALAAERAPVLTPDQEAAIDEVVQEAALEYKVRYPA